LNRQHADFPEDFFCHCERSEAIAWASKK